MLNAPEPFGPPRLLSAAERTFDAPHLAQAICSYSDETSRLALTSTSHAAFRAAIPYLWSGKSRARDSGDIEATLKTVTCPIESIVHISADIGQSGIAPSMSRYPNLRSIDGNFAPRPPLWAELTDHMVLLDNATVSSRIAWKETSDGQKHCFVEDLAWAHWTSDGVMAPIKAIPRSRFASLTLGTLRWELRPGGEADWAILKQLGCLPLAVHFSARSRGEARQLIRVLPEMAASRVPKCSLRIWSHPGSDETISELMKRGSSLGATLRSTEIAFEALDVSRVRPLTAISLLDGKDILERVSCLILRVNVIALPADETAAYPIPAAIAPSSLSRLDRIQIVLTAYAADLSPDRCLPFLRHAIITTASVCAQLGSAVCHYSLEMVIMNSSFSHRRFLSVDEVCGDMTEYAPILRLFNSTIANLTGRVDDPTLRTDFPVSGDDSVYP